ncbi:hypothetical protein V3C99_005321 [Haemonchus contortus]
MDAEYIAQFDEMGIEDRVFTPHTPSLPGKFGISIIRSLLHLYPFTRKKRVSERFASLRYRAGLSLHKSLLKASIQVRLAGISLVAQIFFPCCHSPETCSSCIDRMSWIALCWLQRKALRWWAVLPPGRL